MLGAPGREMLGGFAPCALPGAESSRFITRGWLAVGPCATSFSEIRGAAIERLESTAREAGGGPGIDWRADSPSAEDGANGTLGRNA